jgi:molybdate transport system ATP-binding protein
MSAALLAARIHLPLADFSLDLDINIQGGVTAVLGASGAGKTSFLETLAGLREPLKSKIVLGGRVLEDTSIIYCLPPESRRVGYLPQDVLLFPHLSVLRNLEYGMRRARDGEAPTLSDVVGVLGIGKLLDESPDRLSGGERQRVGLARALLSGAEWLLLDEPLSALDGGLKGRVLPYLRRIRERFGTPILYVTHDLTDILTLANEVVVLEKGRVRAQGTPMEVLAAISADPGWEGVGVENLLEGFVEEQLSEKGLTGLRVGEARLWTSSLGFPVGAKVRVSFSAEDVMLSTEPVRGISARNVLKGRVEKLVHDGSDILKGWVGFPLLCRLTRGAVEELGLAEGGEAYFILKSGSIRCEAIEPDTDKKRFAD